MISGCLSGGTAISRISTPGILQHFVERFTYARNPAKVGHFLRNLGRSRCDRHHVETRVGVRFQVHVAHDEAGADRADSKVGARRQVGIRVQVQVQIQAHEDCATRQSMKNFMNVDETV